MKRRYCKQRSSAERAKWYGCIPNGIGEVKSEAHPASRGRTAQLPEDRAEHVGARSVGWPRNPWLRPSTGWRARYPLIEGIRRMVPWIEAQVEPRGRSSVAPWHFGLVDKLACVVADRSDVTDRVTLSCLCAHGGRAELGIDVYR